jgi:hypothetical protein
MGADEMYTALEEFGYQFESIDAIKAAIFEQLKWERGMGGAKQREFTPEETDEIERLRAENEELRRKMEEDTSFDFGREEPEAPAIEQQPEKQWGFTKEQEAEARRKQAEEQLKSKATLGPPSPMYFGQRMPTLRGTPRPEATPAWARRTAPPA